MNDTYIFEVVIISFFVIVAIIEYRVSKSKKVETKKDLFNIKH